MKSLSSGIYKIQMKNYELHTTLFFMKKDLVFICTQGR